MKTYGSWGNFPSSTPSYVVTQNWLHEEVDWKRIQGSLLPYGNGRSYGDCCLNNGNTLLDVSGLNRIISFDSTSGIIHCEAGVLLSDILSVAVPNGWFLPVSPGTKYVTVGGAIANDIHGKNHHVDGSFGNHVLSLELLRSDGRRYHCSPTINPDLFKATVAGIGLTGIITHAEFRLRPIKSAYIEAEFITFANIHEFFDITAESVHWPYTVAWGDCLASGKHLGRGIFIRGKHAECSANAHPSPDDGGMFSVPFYFPEFVLSTFSIRVFNTLYYHKTIRKFTSKTIHYDSFFYPLDCINHWNRIYGKRGFLQYQFVVPAAGNNTNILKILGKIADSGIGSFLMVMKVFGAMEAVGMMSFPSSGFTIALDFPNVGRKLFTLLDDLDRIVQDSGGRVYIAKDARMGRDMFNSFYPNWQQFASFVDPKFSSTFWRRVSN